MHPIRQLSIPLALLASLAFSPVHAETFNTCGTVIASIPTVISAPGVYCLTHDVNTAVTSGKAISINGNNITLDCNGYKIGGLAAGTSSGAVGVYADNTRQNITIRNCGIRGFFKGIELAGGAGHLIEDNRLDNNLYYAVYVLGDNSLVQRNRIYDTGGETSFNSSYGIYGSADVLDNTVSGVFAVAADTYITGIFVNGDGAQAHGNRVRGLSASGTGTATGILVTGQGVRVDNNHVSASAVLAGTGIQGFGVVNTFCSGNTVSQFATAIANCQDAGGNASN